MRHETNDTPWRTPLWFCSPHNFEPAIRMPPHRAELHHITVRDGEECADVAFTVDDKVRIAEALALVGLKRMELFLTVPGCLEAVAPSCGASCPWSCMSPGIPVGSSARWSWV